MYRKVKLMFLVLLLASGPVFAHQWTPTYVQFRPSYVKGISVVKMELFNSRMDIDYYSIGAFDVNWNPVKFVSSEEILNVKYRQRRSVDIYVNTFDVPRVVYICSKSKILTEEKDRALVSSRICSKVK
jgi:hypothetical protein